MVANLGAITTTATTGCTDALSPGDSSYDNARAAEDLERLRSTWDVPGLAIMGIGNGAQIAVAYAARTRRRWPGWCWTPHPAGRGC